MAGRKTTKKTDEEILEVKEEVLAEETAVADKKVETNEALTEEATQTSKDSAVAAEEEKAVEDAEDAEKELVEDAEDTEKEPELIGDVIVDEETKELIDEVASVGEALERGDELITEEAIGKELEHVEELEKKLTEKVNESSKNVKNIKTERFRDFWCGVSDGWNN